MGVRTTVDGIGMIARVHRSTREKQRSSKTREWLEAKALTLFSAQPGLMCLTIQY
jgi:hypothetical protein